MEQRQEEKYNQIIPSSSIDIQPKIDEFRIVGSTGSSVGISSIKAGDGSASQVIQSLLQLQRQFLVLMLILHLC